MILMSHPLHGFVHVYDDNERAERERKGWKLASTESDLVALNAAIDPPKKRGRPKKAKA